jgi:hypothetical protein
MSIVQQIENFSRRVIEYHGFRLNEGFSCLIPDKESYPSNEGLLLWVFSQRRKRFETKIEKFHLSPRIKRMNNMLGLSEKEYSTFSRAIIAYLKSLTDIGFTDIGKGVDLFGKGKVYNLHADVSIFKNKLEVLKYFEKLTLSNPIVDFAETHGYFEVKNRETLVWDDFFGTATKSVKASINSKSFDSQGKKIQSKTVAKPLALDTQPIRKKTSDVATTSLSDKLKKLATQKPISVPDWEKKRNVWVRQVKELYKNVKSWLSSHVEDGYITLNFQSFSMSDANVGEAYELDSLELELVGGHQVVFQPIEMNMLNAVGRVDLQHYGNNGHRVMLLLFDRGKSRFGWELCKGFKEERQPFNKETLEEILNQWIGD